MADPQAYFSDPQQVIDSADLSKQQKVAVLEQWKNDLTLQQVAEEENMPGDTSNSELIRAVSNALESLRD